MPREPGHKLAKGVTRLEAEALRCSVYQGESEELLLREAMAEVRRREIERCERELRIIQSLPEDYPDRAGYVAIWDMDWRKEKELLEAQG